MSFDFSSKIVAKPWDIPYSELIRRKEMRRLGEIEDELRNEELYKQAHEIARKSFLQACEEWHATHEGEMEYSEESRLFHEHFWIVENAIQARAYIQLLKEREEADE
jgi:hypothetical protein